MTRALFSLFLIGCAADPTQIMVVVHSDMSIPDQLDEVHIDVQGLGEQPTARADLRTEVLPRTLALVRTSGSVGPITVDVSGYREGALVVARQARVSFVAGDARVLVIWLRQSCVGAVCSDGDTCTEDGCRGVDIGTLPPWTGELPPADAGPQDDAGTDTALDTPLDVPIDVPLDAPLDAPLDVPGDVPVDVPFDAAPCTMCPPITEIPGALECENLTCALTCRDGLGDCDMLIGNGCERALNTLTDCDGCGATCPPTSASAVESADCASGTCLIVCVDGFGDCNGRIDDGCERDLQSDRIHCGMCGMRCPGGMSCVDGSCN